MRSVKLGLLAAGLLAATALTTPAFATGANNTCAGLNNCNQDNDTYNQGGTGIGVGIGVGKGGDAYAKGGNADVDNINKNYNTDINANFNKVHNDVDVKNTNKNYNANVGINKNYNTNKQYQDQDQHQKQGQLQGQAQSVENVGNVHIENKRPPVNTAYSAALAVGEDTCMGSSSIGGQAVSFGLTLGTTWTDDNCQRLKNSRQLVALGYHRAATALMCFNEDVAAAMERAGTPCPSGPAVYVEPPPPPEREYVPMAPVPDQPVKRKRRKLLPPK